MSATKRAGELRSIIDPAILPAMRGSSSSAGCTRPGPVAQPARRTCAGRGRAVAQQVDQAWRPSLKDFSATRSSSQARWIAPARPPGASATAPERAGRRLFAALAGQPNPLGLSVVRLLPADVDAGVLSVNALDCLDGIPVIDIKPSGDQARDGKIRSSRCLLCA